MLNIQILSVDECLQLASTKTNYNIVSIRSRDVLAILYDEIDIRKSNYNSIHVEYFDDIISDRSGNITPTVKQVKDILDYSSQFEDNFAVHCTGGVSRSSAIAFLIAFQKTGSKEEAIKYLNLTLHSPNTLIIKLGGLIFSDMDMFPFILEEQEKHDKKFKDRFEL